MKIYKDGSVMDKEFESISGELDKDTDVVLMSFTKPTKIKFLSHSYKIL